MSFSQENGYLAPTFDEVMSSIRVEINTQFLTTYTAEDFVGTAWYKYAYAVAQRVMSGEIRTAQIFQKLQEYIRITNQKIQRPSVSLPGLIDSFESRGFMVSVKPPAEADAGLIAVCVDLVLSDDDYAAKKLEVAGLLKDFVAAGAVFVGDQTENIVLSNGQSFPFSFSLPNRITVKLRLTATPSENSFAVIPADSVIRQIIADNVAARYRLGYNFEPQRYFTFADAPWAGSYVLEWSDDDGVTWEDTVFDADFEDLFEIALEDIDVVIT